MASICSVTFIEPSSAPMPAPTRPATTNPVTIGPISWMIENTMAAGSMDFAPKRARLLRLSSARTVPMAAPARATSGNDFDPISSNCRMISRSSNGLVTAAQITFQEKLPRSPNHSSERLIIVPVEVEVDSIFDKFYAHVPGRSNFIQSRVQIGPNNFWIDSGAESFEGQVNSYLWILIRRSSCWRFEIAKVAEHRIRAS